MINSKIKNRVNTASDGSPETAQKRLQKGLYGTLEKKPVGNVTAHPLEDNILEWFPHFFHLLIYFNI